MIAVWQQLFLCSATQHMIIWTLMVYANMVIAIFNTKKYNYALMINAVRYKTMI